MKRNLRVNTANNAIYSTMPLKKNVESVEKLTR